MAGTDIATKMFQFTMGYEEYQIMMKRCVRGRMDKIEEAQETLKTMYM